MEEERDYLTEYFKQYYVQCNNCGTDITRSPEGIQQEFICTYCSS